MAKKTNSKELVQVALDSHRWINTPVVYTTFGANFNRFQQDVMLQVSGHLQAYMKQYLDDGRYLNKEKPKPIFTSEVLAKGIPPVRIELSNLNVGDTHYSDVDAALDSLRSLWAKKPVFDEQTGIKKGEDWKPVFKNVFVPESAINSEGIEYQYQGSDKVNDDGTVERYVPKRKGGYIDVTINDEVAAYVFDMSRGYFNHLERIAYFCNSAHTSRIYLLLMQYVSRGQMSALIPYMELKDHLGMIERKEKSDEILSVKYDKFSQFCKQVLDVAKKDLERLSDENKTEIEFDYEAIYRGMRKRGNPDFIKFKITRTELGKARDQRLHRNQIEEPKKPTPQELEPSLFDGVGEDPVTDNTTSTPDLCGKLLDELRHAYGSGQMGYDYYFGRRAYCQTTVVDGVKTVYIAIPAFGYDKLSSSPNEMNRIQKCVASVFGDTTVFKLHRL